MNNVSETFENLMICMLSVKGRFKGKCRLIQMYPSKFKKLFFKENSNSVRPVLTF